MKRQTIVSDEAEAKGRDGWRRGEGETNDAMNRGR